MLGKGVESEFQKKQGPAALTGMQGSGNLGVIPRAVADIFKVPARFILLGSHVYYLANYPNLLDV